MHLTTLKIENFRNIISQDLHCSEHCNVFLGKNGQGKTSALEAINIVACGKSFRTASNQEIVNFAAEYAIATAKVISSKLSLETELKVEISKNGRSRFYLHNKPSKLSDGYLGRLIVVAFVPSDTEIIRGSPSERRKFLDKHLVDIFPAHLSTLIRYQKALKSKIALLSKGVSNSEYLEPWDIILAECGAEITQSRIKFIEELKRHISDILPLVAPKDGRVELSLKILGLNGVEPNEENYLKAIREIRFREIASQRALLGPHRDDLQIELNGSTAREFSSQGQARTLTLLLKLAVIELIEAKTRESPLVILDDVDSELDEGRAKFLFNIFAEKKRQLFISSTTKNDLWPEHSKVFNVQEGGISG